MAQDVTELVNSLGESTRKRKRTAAEQHEAVSVATASLEPRACIECTENDISLNEITAGNGTLGLGESNIQNLKKTKGSNLNDSLAERISPKNGDNSSDIVENDSSSENNLASSKSSDGKAVSLAAGKIAQTTGEKLWDGSLHLNSSVTLSAVAFFKSGEKMCDVKWSDIAEVRGKVRLDDLERYIQDISRSRNKGLMVISLCWKEGSSITGFDGMKKVAKCYKKEERVGFVKLSPGVDLYVCPCSDAIITILAKHGFFKGMSAVVDNKDSLIGCVVWRKNGASTSFATKKSDGKNFSLPEQSLNSSFGSSNQKSAENDQSSEQPVQKSIPIARETESSTLESKGNSRNEGKHLKSSEIQLGLCDSSSSANILLTSSILRPETFSAPNCSIRSSSLKGSMSQSSEVEAPPIHKSSMERTKLSLVPQKPVLSLPSVVTKRPTPTLDDLPEFDFGTSCGVFQTPRSVHAVTVDGKLLTEGSRKMDGSMQPTMPTLRSLSTFNKQRSEDFNCTMFPLNETQRMPLPKKVYEHEEQQTAQSRGIEMPVTATAVNSKNFFDDGDVSEWRPPNVELYKLPVPWVTYQSTTSVPLKVPNSTTSVQLKVPNSLFGDLTFSHPRSSPVVPQIAPPSITSGPSIVPNSTSRSFSFSNPRPSLFVPRMAPPSITSSPLKVPNSTSVSFSFRHPRPLHFVSQIIPPSITSGPLKVPNSTSRSFSFSDPRPLPFVPRINSPSITSVPMKVPNSTSGSFSFRHPNPYLVAYPHCPNNAFPRANYCSIDTTVKAVPPRPPKGYVQRAPGTSMVFGANPPSRPPSNHFAFKPRVNPAGSRG